MRQGFCDCCDTYRPLNFYDSWATGETHACAVCANDERAYHRHARFGQGFIPQYAVDRWQPLLDYYERVSQQIANSLP